MTLDSPHNLYLHLVLLREGLKRCLYRLEFQVVDFGETVSERSRARDTSGKSPSINTLFDKAGLSRERVCLSLSLSLVRRWRLAATKMLLCSFTFRANSFH